MSFQEELTEDQRLVILRNLDDIPGHSANDSVLQMTVNKIGHKISRDVVRTHLSWLKENGLVSIENVLGVLVATLTRRGSEVANGLAEQPGVRRPGPRG